MRSSLARVATTIIVGLGVAACASAPSPPPSRTPASTPAASPSSTGDPAEATSLPPLPASADLPVRGSARENSDHVVLTAPGPELGLYILIPMRAAPAVLALVDSTGRPRAGWPVVVPGATFCSQLLPVDDGSVRVVCTMENPEGNMFDPIGAFGFDSNGRLLAGWPVALLGTYITGQVVGDDLALYVSRSLGDVIPEGQPSFDGGLVTVDADGALTNGSRLTDLGHCCMWLVGADGVAYGVAPATTDPSPEARVSSITAVDVSGARPGWPVSFDGIASGPAFGPGERTIVVVGSLDGKTSRVLTFDRAGETVSATSSRIPIATVEFGGDTGGCSTSVPQPPVVARDGTTFVYSELDTTVYALDPSMSIKAGWPFRPDAPLARARPGFESEHEAGYCPPPVVPAVGADGVLYLPLQATSSTVGGSLVAVGPDGRVRPGWPVELRRPGAEFWSVVVGVDGTAYALAIEPETGDTSSATILAIAPDSTVLHTVTIIEP